MNKSPSRQSLGAPLVTGWLRTKGRDSTLGGTRVQQMKSWNLWWSVLSPRTGSSGPLFTLRCYTDETLSQQKVRRSCAPARAQLCADLDASCWPAPLPRAHPFPVFFRRTSCRSRAA